MSVYNKSTYCFVLAAFAANFGFASVDSIDIKDIKDQELVRFNFVKDQINSCFQDFYSIEKFLNIDEKKLLIEVSSIYESEINELTENFATENLDLNKLQSLVSLVHGFKSACLKIEILAVHEISDLQAQKIKLKVLADLFKIYKQHNSKNAFKYSNKLVSTTVFNNLPDNFKQSIFKRIIFWYCAGSRKFYLVWSLITQDYCKENIVFADKFVDLVMQFNGHILGDKKLDYDVFLGEVVELIQNLFKENPKDTHLTVVISLMIEKLIIIKEHIISFCKNVEKFGFDVNKLKLLTRFKVLKEDPKFKFCRTGDRFATTLDLFVGFMQQMFDKNSITQSDLVRLFQIKQKIINLIASIDSGIIAGLFLQKADTLIVLEEALEIINLSGDVFMGKEISQDENISLDVKGSMIGGFVSSVFNNKFKKLSEFVINMVLKSPPRWFKMILPMLPDSAGNVLSSLFAVASKPQDFESPVTPA